MKTEDYYNRQKGCETKFFIILAVIILLIVASCEKIGEKYDWTCDVMQISQRSGYCPDTVYTRIFKYNVTQDQQLYWITTFQDEQIISFQGDTLRVKNVIIGCGKSVCQ